jgi:hypothetical protein
MLVECIGLASWSGGHFLLASAYRPEIIRMMVTVRKNQVGQGARKIAENVYFDIDVFQDLYGLLYPW